MMTFTLDIDWIEPFLFVTGSVTVAIILAAITLNALDWLFRRSRY